MVHSAWLDEFVEYIKSNQIIELELNQAKGWESGDISFLTKLPDLESFEIYDFNIRNIMSIHNLHKLRRLGVSTYCPTGIDFSAFPKLENCALEWRSKSASIFKCTTLKELSINRYKGKNTDPFAKLMNLESLAILSAPITNLFGLRALKKLRSLRLANLRCLASLEGIEELEGLKELEIHTCRQINSIRELGSLSQLKKLGLNNNGNIDSLKPLGSIRNLEMVVFYETTNIIDGDLLPLLSQRNLARVSFQNRRHYSHRREDFGNAYMR